MRSSNRWRQLRFNLFRRREFITPPRRPLAARAQQTAKLPTIGFLGAISRIDATFTTIRLKSPA
jgi:hypothetical protein